MLLKTKILFNPKAFAGPSNKYQREAGCGSQKGHPLQGPPHMNHEGE